MEYYKIFVVTILLIALLPDATRSKNTASFQGRIKDIFKRLILPDKTLLFIVDTPNEYCVEAIKESDHPRVILDVDRPVQRNMNIMYTYVLCTDNVSWVKKALNKLTESKLFNKGGKRGQYLLISGNTKINKTIKEFQKHNIYNVTLLQRLNKLNHRKNKPNKHNIQLKSFLPQIVVYEVFENIMPRPPHIKSILLMLPTWFSDRDPFYSTRGELLYEHVKIIGDALNVPVSYIYSNHFKPCPIDKLCLFTKFTYVKDLELEPSSSFLTDTEIFFVPRVKKANKIESMIFVFEWPAFAMLFLVFLFVIIISWLMARLLNEHSSLQRLGTWTLIATQHLVGLAITRLPRSICLRTLMIFYIFYSLQLSYTYQSNMTGVLSEPDDEEEILSIKELSESNLPWIITNFQKNALIEKGKEVYEKIKPRIKMVPYGMTVTKRLLFAEKYKYVTYMERETFNYAFPQLKGKLYPITDFVLEHSSYSLYPPNGHYFYKKLLDFNRRIMESGLKKIIIKNIKSKYETKKEQNDTKSNIYLEFRHLKEVFLFLLVGLSVATLAFLCELFHFYYFNRILNLLRRQDH